MAGIRIAIAQIRATKGDYTANLERLGGVFAQVAGLDPKLQLVVTPEAITSGYFVEGGVRDVAVTAGTLFPDLPEKQAAAEGPPLHVAGGFFPGFSKSPHKTRPLPTPGPE